MSKTSSTAISSQSMLNSKMKPLSPGFFGFFSYYLLTSLPKQNECGRIAGSSDLNFIISVPLTNK